MYGLVNQGIKDLIINKFDEETWKSIVLDNDLPYLHFSPLKSYSDEVTYNLIESICSHLDLKQEEVLYLFGKEWILYTSQKGYGALINIFGKDFLTFLVNLNKLHKKIGMLMLDLAPPKFEVLKKDNNIIIFKYYSKRDGLKNMVIGLLDGLAEKFNEPIVFKEITTNTMEENLKACFEIEIKK